MPQEILNFLKTQEFVKSGSNHTLRAYKNDLNGSFRGLGSVSAEVLFARIKGLPRTWAALSPRTRNRKTACLRSFLKYLEQQNKLPANSSLRLFSVKAPRRLPRVISVDEILALWKTCEASKDFTTQMLFLLLYGSGLRVSEACGALWSHVDFSKRTLRLLGKGNKERIVALPEISLKLLQSKKPVGPWVWGEKPLDTRVAYEIIRQLGVKTGLLFPIHPHLLRHSCASHLLTSGANLRVIQDLLGHASLQSTEIYTHLSVDHLARVMESHHPLSRPTKTLRKSVG